MSPHEIVTPCVAVDPSEAIEVVVIGDDERPVEDLAIVLGCAAKGHQGDVTDARGRCRFEGVPPGATAQVSIAGLDRDAWELVVTRRLAPEHAQARGTPTWPKPAPTPSPAVRHTVRAGECLYRLGHTHGVLPETLWRANAGAWGPHHRKGVLSPGMTLTIPERRVGWVDVPAGHVAVLHRIGIPVVMSIRLVDARGEPWADCPYVLELRAPGRAVPRQVGVTSREGRLNVPVLPDVREGRLSIEPRGGGRRWTVSLRIGELQPADEIEGARARLWNLGYRGAATRLWREDDVVSSFRDDALDAAPGPLDDDTARALAERHGS